MKNMISPTMFNVLTRVIIFIILTVVNSNANGQITGLGKINSNFNGTEAFNYVYLNINCSALFKKWTTNIISEYVIHLYRAAKSVYRDGLILDPLVWCKHNIRDHKTLPPYESEDSYCNYYMNRTFGKSAEHASTALEYAYYNIIENASPRILNNVAKGYYLYMVEEILPLMNHTEAQGPKMYCNNFFPEEQRNTIDQHQPEQRTFPVYERVPIENTYPINYNPVGQEMYPYHILNNDQLMANAPFNSQSNNVAFTENSFGFHQSFNYGEIRQGIYPVYDGTPVENVSDESQSNTFPSTELSIGRPQPVNYSAVGQGAYPFYNYTPMANVYSENQSNIDPSTELTIGSYQQAVQNPEQFPDTDNIPFQFLPSSSNVAPGYRYAYDTDKK